MPISKGKKLFIIFNVLILLFFNSYLMPKAHANAWAWAPRFLPVAFAVPGAGQALMVVAVIAAASYVAIKYEDEITEILHNATTLANGYYDSLTQSVKNKWESAANAFNFSATTTQTIVLDAEMASSVTDYVVERTLYTSLQGRQNFVPLINKTDYFASGSIPEQYVLDHYAFKAMINGIEQYFIPTWTVFSESRQDFDYMQYQWAYKQENGLYRAQTRVSTATGTFSGLILDKYSTKVRFDDYGRLDVGVGYSEGGAGFIFENLSSILGKARVMAELKLGVTTIPSTWVDVISPKPDAFPNIGEIKVPPGVITGTTSAPVITFTQAAITEAVVGTWPDVTNPPVNPPGGRPLDPGQVPKPPLNFVTTKFPFSLPWDVYHLISLIAADPITPKIEVDKDLNGMPFKFNINLSFLDPYIIWFRTFILLGFGFYLISNTSRWFGGAK